MRTRTPFIEAFKTQQNEKHKAQPASTEKVEIDSTPKTMSDSHTKIVGHVTCAGWNESADESRYCLWHEIHGFWTRISTLPVI